MKLSDEVSNVVRRTICLTHQLPEDQPSSIGLICSECHARMLRDPPIGPCRSFWESQPVTLEGECGSVFALVWENFQIRSLHPDSAWEEAERLARSVIDGHHRQRDPGNAR